MSMELLVPQRIIQELHRQKQDYDICIIFVAFDANKYGTALPRLREIIKSHGLSAFFIVLNNAIDGDKVIGFLENGIEISGDNSSWEFSGWQKGIDLLKIFLYPFQAVLFINDSFLVYGRNFIENDFFPRLIYNNLINECSAMGYLDTKKRTHIVLKYDVSSWLRSNAILVSRNAVAYLPNLVAVDGDMLNEFFQNKPNIVGFRNEYELIDSIFKRDAPLNDAMKEDVVRWLTREWHSKFELCDRTWDFFRKKTRAILNEALLTARMRENGVDIIDVSKFS